MKKLLIATVLTVTIFQSLAGVSSAACDHAWHIVDSSKRVVRNIPCSKPPCRLISTRYTKKYQCDLCGKTKTIEYIKVKHTKCGGDTIIID